MQQQGARHNLAGFYLSFNAQADRSAGVVVCIKV
jgi:hypothetical protein